MQDLHKENNKTFTERQKTGPKCVENKNKQQLCASGWDDSSFKLNYRVRAI